MTPEDREDFYDREVAPVLMDLAKKCQDNGLSIAAMVEWEPGETGRTAALSADASFGIRMVEAAMQARGNVDSLIFAIQKYAAEHGHSSICLKMLEDRPGDRYVDASGSYQSWQGGAYKP
jgi:hypothetical protein